MADGTAEIINEMISSDVAFALPRCDCLAADFLAHVAKAGVKHANNAFHVVATVKRLLDRTGWNACKGLASRCCTAIVF